MISVTFPYHKKRKPVLGVEMAYVDEGQGDPIVFLHGNPTFSYIWRTILPHVKGLGRVIAPDLIGMGDSEKLPGSGPGPSPFVEHRSRRKTEERCLLSQWILVLERRSRRDHDRATPRASGQKDGLP